MSSLPEARTERLADRKLPPIAEIGMFVLALIVAGGIYLAANLPRHVSLRPAEALLVLAVVSYGVALVLMARIEEFNWERFAFVGIRALAANVVTAGMIEFVFVLDHTRGHVLVVLSAMLVVFALDVPTIMAFTVARYQPLRPAS